MEASDKNLKLLLLCSMLVVFNRYNRSANRYDTNYKLPYFEFSTIDPIYYNFTDTKSYETFVSPHFYYFNKLTAPYIPISMVVLIISNLDFTTKMMQLIHVQMRSI